MPLAKDCNDLFFIWTLSLPLVSGKYRRHLRIRLILILPEVYAIAATFGKLVVRYLFFFACLHSM